MREQFELGAFFHNKRTIGLLLIGSILCVGFAMCVASIWPAIQVEQGPIVVRDAFLTTEVAPNGTTGERATEFPVDTPRIWCIVDVEAPKPVRVGVRWYYGEKLLWDHIQVVERRGGWYIEPPPGEQFAAGEYRVEVYLVRKAIRTLYFRVVAPK
ncbi:hypothetical protein [Thermogutta sp.]|uniref:hypothetical protein n=1 Tax=Thermogutta sp. TaxID=1962930 RepID=UPI00322051B4